MIIKSVKKQYKIALTNSYIISGYLFSALVQKGNLLINFEELDYKAIVENDIDYLNLKHLREFDIKCESPLYIGYQAIKKILKILKDKPSKTNHE